jgi:hypothetical protein
LERALAFREGVRSEEVPFGGFIVPFGGFIKLRASLKLVWE